MVREGHGQRYGQCHGHGHGHLQILHTLTMNENKNKIIKIDGGENGWQDEFTTALGDNNWQLSLFAKGFKLRINTISGG